MLGDIRTAVMEFVNDALNEGYAITDKTFLRALQACLNDLGNDEFLIGQDTDQALVAGGLTLAYPTDYKSLISIVLIDSSSVRQRPLVPLVEGYEGYCRLRGNDSNTSIPRWYAEHNSLFHLWRPAGGAYTSEIDYYRYHPQTPEDILFSEEFRNAIEFGTTYFKALFAKKLSEMKHWRAIYYEEKGNRRGSAPETPHFVNG